MTKRATKEEFVNRAIIKHLGKYTYENVVYEAMLKKVSITCAIHGNFLQKPADHLGGHGCPKCKGAKSACKWNDIKKQFYKIHGSYYSYDDSTYFRNSIKMKMCCPKHGEFWQKPELHKNGSGCKLCTASSGPGKYCEKVFEKQPELKEKPGILYFIELNDTDGNKFYKVGITMNLRTRYYDFIEKNGGRICWTENKSLYECFKKEQEILNKFKNFKYKPKLRMAGKTECLTKEIKYDF